MKPNTNGTGERVASKRAWRQQVGEGAFSPHFHAASELIGRRWTGAIVRALFHGCTRFREIADAIPGISDRLLSERLKELAAHGVVEQLDGRDGYHLTEKGRDLRPILIEIARWAHRWDVTTRDGSLGGRAIRGDAEPGGGRSENTSPDAPTRSPHA